MRNSSRYVGYRPPSFSMSLTLAWAMLLAFLGSNGSAFHERPCPALYKKESPPIKWPACPDGCKCSSKDTQLQCLGPDLPQLGDADVMNLGSMAVEGVGIQRLETDHFRGLGELLHLTLSDGRISEIAENAFVDLSSLTSLDLSNNEIVVMPVDAFLYNKNLFFLVLDGNPLHVPSSGPLLRSTSVLSLSIQRCGIASVNSQIFSGVKQLIKIYMDDNPLTEFPSEAVGGLTSLCYIDDNVLFEDLTTDVRDTNTGIVDRNTTGFDFRLILIIGGVILVTAVALVGAYKISKAVGPCRKKQEVVVPRSHHNLTDHTNRRTEAPVSMYAEISDHHMIDGLGGYRILSQREFHPPPFGYPGYVYNGVDFSSTSAIDRDSYVENGLYAPPTNFRQPTDRLPLPPPYEDIGRPRLLSRQESVGTSTSDLQT